MVVHVQAWVDILRYSSEKIETFSKPAWVKATHEDTSSSNKSPKIVTVMGRRPVTFFNGFAFWSHLF